MAINSSFDKYLFFRTLDNNVIAVSVSDSLNIESEDDNNSNNATGENQMLGASLNLPEDDSHFVVVTMLEDGSRTILYNNGDVSIPGTWEVYMFL
ncbi:MAG: hypothetical protein SWZ49_27065 [Cyanobacteriota bacterium]|nr:hypothetical protein [Cyanobacteriota bacterium]